MFLQLKDILANCMKRSAYFETVEEWEKDSPPRIHQPLGKGVINLLLLWSRWRS